MRNALDHFDSLVGSMERNLLPKARRLQSLGVGRSESPIQEVELLQRVPRIPQLKSFGPRRVQLQPIQPKSMRAPAKPSLRRNEPTRPLLGSLAQAAATPKHSEHEPALAAGDQSLTLWAESPDEARAFLSRISTGGETLPITKIFVAKRSPKSRSNAYMGGEYYRTSDDSDVDVYDEVVLAPTTIVDLVQWGTCDVILSRGSEPIVVIEDTTHIVRMNLYQRVPRVARAADLGVPALVLQGTRGLDLTKRGDLWGLHRYLQVFDALANLYPNNPPLAIHYLATPAGERDAQDQLVKHVVALVEGDRAKVDADRRENLSGMRSVLTQGVNGKTPRDIPCIDHTGAEVVVRIGARPHRKSWVEKGSGQRDPYLGLIAAAKYIYCYGPGGRKVKRLVVEFTYLPRGFWFFENPNSTALYKRLPFELADEVRFLG